MKQEYPFIYLQKCIALLSLNLDRFRLFVIYQIL